MARKPNYRFERMERDRQKAAKKAARAEAKAKKSEMKKGGEDGILPEADEFAGPAPVEPPIEPPIEASLEAPAGPREE